MKARNVIIREYNKITEYLEYCELTEYEIGINEMYGDSDSDSNFKKFIILEYSKIKYKTEKAYLIERIDDFNYATHFWIPKSLCVLNEEDNLISIPKYVLNYK